MHSHDNAPTTKTSHPPTRSRGEALQKGPEMSSLRWHRAVLFGTRDVLSGLFLQDSGLAPFRPDSCLGPGDREDQEDANHLPKSPLEKLGERCLWGRSKVREEKRNWVQDIRYHHRSTNTYCITALKTITSLSFLSPECTPFPDTHFALLQHNEIRQGKGGREEEGTSVRKDGLDGSLPPVRRKEER